jgi:starch synthase
MSPEPTQRSHRILLCAAECVPYAKTGGLADVVAALGSGLRRAGHDARILMPYYRGMFELDSARMRRVAVDATDFSWAAGPVSVIEYQGATEEEPIVYFVENDTFFARAGIYGDQQGSFGDNEWRFAFLAAVALSLPVALNWFPDVYHLHDWHTGLIPTMARRHPGARRRGDLRRARFITTIHNLAHRGVYGEDFPGKIDLPSDVMRVETGEFHGAFSFLKAGLAYSDAMTTVSQTYAREILTPEFGFGLEGFLQARASRMVGIVNGIDTDAWNPETDPHLAANYSVRDLAGKADCKADLQQRAGLPVDPDVPLIGLVSRLDAQKGFDLITPLIPALVAQRVQIIFLGSGQPSIASQLAAAAKVYPRQIATALRFDNALSHRIEAGSDFFLMPSAFEPCGLNQMYSMRYGSVPIVRGTGGLRDTVTPWGLMDGMAGADSNATGFMFFDYAAEALYRALERALLLFVLRRDLYQHVQLNGMKRDFGWPRRVAEYLDLYRRVERLAPLALP